MPRCALGGGLEPSLITHATSLTRRDPWAWHAHDSGQQQRGAVCIWRWTHCKRRLIVTIASLKNTFTGVPARQILLYRSNVAGLVR